VNHSIPLYTRAVHKLSRHLKLILRPLSSFTNFFDSCHAQKLIHDYISFVQLSSQGVYELQALSQ